MLTPRDLAFSGNLPTETRSRARLSDQNDADREPNSEPETDISGKSIIGGVDKFFDVRAQSEIEDQSADIDSDAETPAISKRRDPRLRPQTPRKIPNPGSRLENSDPFGSTINEAVPKHSLSPGSPQHSSTARSPRTLNSHPLGGKNSEPPIVSDTVKNRGGGTDLIDFRDVEVPTQDHTRDDIPDDAFSTFLAHQMSAQNDQNKTIADNLNSGLFELSKTMQNRMTIFYSS